MNEGIISIPAASGTVKAGQKGKITFAEGGTTENFNPQTGSLLLECEIDIPGEYEVKLYTSRHWRKSFAEGTFVTLKTGNNILSNRLLKKTANWPMYARTLIRKLGVPSVLLHSPKKVRRK